jgi:hypothetical protein
MYQLSSLNCYTMVGVCITVSNTKTAHVIVMR